MRWSVTQKPQLIPIFQNMHTKRRSVNLAISIASCFPVGFLGWRILLLPPLRIMNPSAAWSTSIQLKIIHKPINVKRRLESIVAI